MARCTVITVLSLSLEKISYAGISVPFSFVSLNSVNVYTDGAKKLCFTPKTGLDFTQPNCLTDGAVQDPLKPKGKLFIL